MSHKKSGNLVTRCSTGTKKRPHPSSSAPQCERIKVNLTLWNRGQIMNTASRWKEHNLTLNLGQCSRSGRPCLKRGCWDGGHDIGLTAPRVLVSCFRDACFVFCCIKYTQRLTRISSEPALHIHGVTCRHTRACSCNETLETLRMHVRARAYTHTHTHRRRHASAHKHAHARGTQPAHARTDMLACTCRIMCTPTHSCLYLFIHSFALAFRGAGAQPGLEIWRIEKKIPVRVPEAQVADSCKL